MARLPAAEAGARRSLPVLRRGLDASGEDFEPADYALLRATWAEWRSARDLRPPADARRRGPRGGDLASTASRALSGRGYVSPPVRERLLAVADELGYIPNASARTLKQRRVASWASSSPIWVTSSTPLVAAGIAQALRDADYQMLLLGDNSEDVEETEAARTFLAMRARRGDHDAGGERSGGVARLARRSPSSRSTAGSRACRATPS